MEKDRSGRSSGDAGPPADVIDLNRFVGADALRAADGLRDEGVNVTTVSESLPPIAGVLAALAPVPTAEPGDHVVVHTWGNQVTRLTVDAAARDTDRAAQLDARITSLESLERRVGDLKQRVAALEAAIAARPAQGGQAAGRARAAKSISSPARTKSTATPARSQSRAKPTATSSAKPRATTRARPKGEEA